MFNLCCANFLLSHQKLFAAAKCILPICEICEFAKARFNPREQSCQSMMVVLRDLYVLAKSRLLGQKFNSCWGAICWRVFWRMYFCWSYRWDPGCRTSSWISAVETVRQLELNKAMKVCLCNTGISVKIIWLTMGFSMDMAQHENGVAQIVFYIARAMLLNASVDWKNNVEFDLWSMQSFMLSLSITTLEETKCTLLAFSLAVHHQIIGKSYVWKIRYPFEWTILLDFFNMIVWIQKKRVKLSWRPKRPEDFWDLSKGSLNELFIGSSTTIWPYPYE